MQEQYSFWNKYMLAGICTYILACLVLVLKYNGSITEILFLIATIGFCFSSIAILLSKNIFAPTLKPALHKELWMLIGLLLWIVIYITFISSGIKKIEEGYNIIAPIRSLISIVVKLIAFIAIPVAVYKMAGFQIKDFGIFNTGKNKKILLLFIVASAAMLLFQFFLSNGSKPIRNGEFSTKQLMIGLPLCYTWLAIEAGLVEEFFFRVLLQSRLQMITGTGKAAIIWSAIIFGLVHAPGLYLRGAESEGVDEQMPFIYWACYTVVYMSIPGIFFAIIWYRTKRFWLLVAFHAMFDLLPNFKDFIETWQIPHLNQQLNHLSSHFLNSGLFNLLISISSL